MDQRHHDGRLRGVAVYPTLPAWCGPAGTTAPRTGSIIVRVPAQVELHPLHRLVVQPQEQIEGVAAHVEQAEHWRMVIDSNLPWRPPWISSFMVSYGAS